MRIGRGEDGYGLPLVLLVMTVVGLLAGVALMAAQDTTSSANADRRSKRALGAAEAGLQEAAYRMSKLRPAATMCLGSGPSYTSMPASGECPAVTGSSATDATFAYHGTQQLAAGAVCADIAAAVDPLVTNHCVTSTGLVGGVRRRLQALIKVPRRTIFNQIGLLGLDYVRMLNSDTIRSDIGSNGQVTGTNSVSVTGSVIVPNTAPLPSISGSNPPTVRRPDPWALAQVDYEASRVTNQNANLVGLNSGGTTRYDSAARTVTLNNSVEYTLTSGTYNLCDFYADNSVKIRAQNAATRIQLFIDSPDRPGSNCAAGTGRFCLDNSVEFNKDPGDANQAARFEIYVYGSTARCSDGRPGLPFDGTQIGSLPAHAPVVLNNSVEFHGTIYSPTSRVILTNSIKMYGGIASKSTDLGNSVEFTYPNSVRNQTPAPADIQRLSWVECRALPTVATDPESGCA